jgi:hypothetical protein
VLCGWWPVSLAERWKWERMVCAGDANGLAGFFGGCL